MPPRFTVQLNAFSADALWSLTDSDVAELVQAFPEVRVVATRDRESFLATLPEARALYTWSLPEQHFGRAQELAWVHTPAAGVERLLHRDLIKSDVLVTCSKGLAAAAVADHAMALLYALTRRLGECRDAQREGAWIQRALWGAATAPRALAGRTLLIVGLGAVGCEIARRAHAARMKVVGVRRRAGGPAPEGVQAVGGPAALGGLLADADAIALALPNTPLTHNVLGAAQLQEVKPGALIVNVGRGAAIDETALAAALASGRVGGAGLDVFADEPLAPASPLWRHPAVVITPHVAGVDPEHMARATALFASNLRRFLRGQPLANLVDKRAGY